MSGLVAVAGDLTIDWNISRLGRAVSEEAWNANCLVRAHPRAGGVTLLSSLLERVVAPAPGTLSLPWAVKPSRQAPDILDAADRSVHHAYALWEPFEKRLGDKDKNKARGRDEQLPQVWRARELLGADPRDAVAAGTTSANPGPERAGLIVLDDAGLGFREDDRLWPAALDDTTAAPPWVILKMASPVATGPLWTKLTARPDRLIVVLTANDLRLTNVSISRELSWERTAQDLYRALVESHLVNTLARCAHVVVSFGPDGAFHLENRETRDGAAGDAAGDGARKKLACTLYFDPTGIEGAWRQGYPGSMVGYTTCMVGGLARQVMLDPANPKIDVGIQTGVAATRALHEVGYDTDEAHGRPGRLKEAALAFPTAKVAATLRTHDLRPCATAIVPYPKRPGARGADPERRWTILEDRVTQSGRRPSEEQDRVPGSLLDLAELIVLNGSKKTLRGIPQFKVKALQSIDRREIEGYRALRAVMVEYVNQDLQRPLSVAVFGSPGAGKSFAVKQIAAVLPRAVEELTFNLSQLAGPDALRQAFHRVRDAGLRGKLPLVFWDEFDTPLGGRWLGWLPHFLAPMQDDEFLEGEILHPLGRAIFVFAGGTCRRMEDFTRDLESEKARRAKLPDFVSRLKGYVDILGPNPDGPPGTDPYFILRRALLLRSTFERNAERLLGDVTNDGDDRPLNIDRGLLRALLRTRIYYHGSRSVESIIAMSRLSDSGQFQRSSLPAESQLQIHVDPEDFGRLLREATMDDSAPDVRDQIEKLAEANHDVYLAGQAKISGASQPANLESYANLPAHEKEQNRAAVRDIPVKLGEIGYVITRMLPDDRPVTIPEEDVEKLAELEHLRWTRAKLGEGWRYASTRDNEKLTHPDMLPWKHPPHQGGALFKFTGEELERLGPRELSETAKQKDRDLVEGIPEILKRADLTIKRVEPGGNS